MLLNRFNEESYKELHRGIIREELCLFFEMMKGINRDRSFTILEAKDYLKISKPTLHKLMRNGSISYFKIRRRTYFKESSLVEFINSNTYLKNENI